jgi:hypothetical protein
MELTVTLMIKLTNRYESEWCIEMNNEPKLQEKTCDQIDEPIKIRMVDRKE